LVCDDGAGAFISSGGEAPEAPDEIEVRRVVEVRSEALEVVDDPSVEEPETGIST
jgi:hypothetical protein